MNPKDQAALAKVPLHLLPDAARIWGAMACKDGAEKYGPFNWREQSISLVAYTGAIERHLIAVRSGEWVDPLSGVPHLGHVIAGAGIVLDADLHDTLTHDLVGTTLEAELIRTINKKVEGGAA